MQIACERRRVWRQASQSHSAHAGGDGTRCHLRILCFGSSVRSVRGVCGGDARFAKGALSASVARSAGRFAPDTGHAWPSSGGGAEPAGEGGGDAAAALAPFSPRAVLGWWRGALDLSRWFPISIIRDRKARVGFFPR
jgi:hypothetical protein